MLPKNKTTGSIKRINIKLRKLYDEYCTVLLDSYALVGHSPLAETHVGSLATNMCH